MRFRLTATMVLADLDSMDAFSDVSTVPEFAAELKKVDVGSFRRCVACIRGNEFNSISIIWLPSHAIASCRNVHPKYLLARE
jgi:hypothetical protein